MKSFIFLGFFTYLACLTCYAYNPNESVAVKADELPREFEEAKITPNLSQSLDKNIIFRDHNDKPVRIGDLLTTGKPTLLSFVYYECPSLCSLHLNGVRDALKDLKSLKMGEDYNVVAVSFNYREKAFLAKKKRASYLKSMGLTEGSKEAEGWSFLTGNKKAIKELASLVGFGFKWDYETKQYVHSSAIVLVSNDGVITQYLNGVMFNPKTLKLAIVEASKGTIGNIIDQMVLYCFQFNPKKGRYTIYAWNVVKASGVLTLLFLFSLIGGLMYKERNRKTGAKNG